MGETAQFMIFRDREVIQHSSNYIANDGADLHYFLDRELQELVAAEQADCEEARHAHRALAAAYRERASSSSASDDPRAVRKRS
jgi:hypothetical protein